MKNSDVRPGNNGMCTRCGVVKREPKRRSYCAACDKAMFRECYENRKEKYREKNRRYYRNHREEMIIKINTRYPKHMEARRLLAKAVKRGDITRQPCIVCGDRKSEGHHPDYSKPIDVIWLCRKHHAMIHHQENFMATITPPKGL